MILSEVVGTIKMENHNFMTTGLGGDDICPGNQAWPMMCVISTLLAALKPVPRGRSNRFLREFLANNVVMNPPARIHIPEIRVFNLNCLYRYTGEKYASLPYNISLEYWHTEKTARNTGKSSGEIPYSVYTGIRNKKILYTIENPTWNTYIKSR